MRSALIHTSPPSVRPPLPSSGCPTKLLTTSGGSNAVSSVLRRQDSGTRHIPRSNPRTILSNKSLETHVEGTCVYRTRSTMYHLPTAARILRGPVSHRPPDCCSAIPNWQHFSTALTDLCEDQVCWSGEDEILCHQAPFCPFHVCRDLAVPGRGSSITDPRVRSSATLFCLTEDRAASKRRYRATL